MTRITTVTPETAGGIRRLLFGIIKRQYGGFVPGIVQVMMVNMKIGRAVGGLYRYLNLRKDSPLSRLQREMLATVVNGIIGGAP